MKGLSGKTVLRAPARNGLGTAIQRRVFAFLAAVCILGGGRAALAQTVKNVQARQRYPWNNLVDIDYTVEGVTETEGLYIRFQIEDSVTGLRCEVVTLDREPSLSNGTHRVTWDPEADDVQLRSTGAVCRATLRRDDPDRYLVVDLSGGAAAAHYPASYLPAVPAGGWTDEYKTTRLVLRKIDPGTFTMGSPTNELGRFDWEDAHPVTLTKPFYIGVFEITQKQWALVKGGYPAAHQGDLRPVDWVPYAGIRGGNWPTDQSVTADNFIDRMRIRTGLAFDLPTDAQWEYACRAGTTTPLNNGKDATDANMAELGRFQLNQSDGRGGYTSCHTTVGSYPPNAWGLYDMHGNVFEWCLDWAENHLGPDPVTDPAGPDSGENRIVRGGSWYGGTDACRSAFRLWVAPGQCLDNVGFRAVCAAEP